MLRTTFLVPAAVAQAVQVAQDFTWAQHIASAGTYDGQRRRIISGVGNRPFWLVYDLANAVWDPLSGDELYYVGAVQTDATNPTQSITLPTVAHPANFWRSGLGLHAEIIVESSASATARTQVMTLGSSNFVNLPTATNRRVGALFGFIATGAAVQIPVTKADSATYSPYDSGNSNFTPMAENLANALNITGSVTITTGGANTMTLRRYKLRLVKG